MLTDDAMVFTLTVGDLRKLIMDSAQQAFTKTVEDVNRVDNLNTPDQTAEKLHCSKTTVFAYRDQGILLETKLSRKKIFFLDSEIERAKKAIKRFNKKDAA